MPRPILAHPLLRALAFTLVVSWPFGAASTAQAAGRAADPFEPDNDTDVKESYRKAIKDGVSEYDAGHFEEALGYFRRAHMLSPNARTLRGMGMAYFELRDYVSAVRNLTVAVQDPRKPLSAEQRKEAEELIERCQMLVAVFSLVVTPSNAQVTVDANVPELQADGRLMLGLGAHVIEARAQGYMKRSLNIQVRGGERKSLVLTLDPLVPVPSVAVAGKTVPSKDLTAPIPNNRVAMTWLLAGGGAALLAGAAGVYWGIQSSHVASCDSPKDPLTRCDDRSVLVRQRTGGAIATIATGTAAVVMATIGILSWKSAPARPAGNPSLACDVGLFGLTCGRSF